MSRSDWLGVLGIVISILLGIPTIPALVPGELIHRVVFGLLALIVFALTLILYIRSKRPPFTILSHHTLFDIKDAQGKVATYRKTITIRPNHPGLDIYAHRNMSSDGSFTNFRVNPGVKILSKGSIGGDHNVYVQFPAPLTCFKPVTTWLEADLVDSFPLDREGVILIVEQPIREAKIEVVLPSSKTATAITAVHRYSDNGVTLDPPHYINNRILFSIERRMFHNIPFGDYEIMWNW